LKQGNLYSRIGAVAAQRPDAPALRSPGRADLSYAGLQVAVARYANVLRAAGVERGDRVLVQVEKSPEALFLYLATLRNGAIFVPLNTAYTASEVRYFAGDAEPRLLVCDPRLEGALRPVAASLSIPRLLTLGPAGDGEFAALATNAAGDCPVTECEAGETAAILYTSGTTGRSKGAMLSHGNLASNAASLIELWRFAAGDVLLHALPIYHVHGLFVAMHCALLSGACTVLLPRLDVGQLVELMPTATVFMGVPTYYTRLLEDARIDARLCASMRLFVCGSAPLLPGTFAAFEQRTGHRILERYGMTEAGMIASNPYEGERVPGTVGFALPGVQARVADEHGNPVETGGAGVLEIKGPNVFGGYWRMPEKTRSEFRPDGFFVTGDVATKQADGRIAIVGRAKDLIISGGFNIYPRELELALDEIPGVQESAVIGVPHRDFGEGVVAVLTLQGAARLTEAEVQANLATRIARFKLPKRVFFVAELPRNAMGKVQKNLLRDTYRDALGPA
jgi:malonyl-CoA/methylmalonyl-CoA synthetase